MIMNIIIILIKCVWVVNNWCVVFQLFIREITNIKRHHCSQDTPVHNHISNINIININRWAIKNAYINSVNISATHKSDMA